VRALLPQQVIAVLARLIARAGPHTARIGGTIQFVVSGAHGGSWLVDLDVAGGAWSKGARATAGTSVFATPEAFPALLDRDQLKNVLHTGQLLIAGDGHRLASLTQLMEHGVPKK
jgi:hypothetical protein